MNVFDLIFKQPLFNALVAIYNVIPGRSLGVAIIVLTILIRLLLYPLAAKALRSQRAIQKYQPQLSELRAKHKGDPQALNKAMMEFYKKHEINPLASCLPTLIQLPFLIALFFVFKDNPSQHLGLLYSFVSDPGPIDSDFLWFSLFGRDPTFALPVLAAALQFLQAKMLLPKHIDKNDPTQTIARQLVYLMPALTFFFALTLPAALPLYWIVSTLFSIIQQRLIMGRETHILEAAPVSRVSSASAQKAAPETKVVEGVTITRSSLATPAVSAPKSKIRRGVKKSAKSRKKKK
jgi:YidC/Oxa1 family membrane protein insertase